MQMPKAALSAVLILLAGCASVSEQQTPMPLNAALSPGDIGVLADLLRREDARQYDSAAFHGFLSSGSEVVRAMSVRALGRMGNRAAVTPLVQALADKSMHVR